MFLLEPLFRGFRDYDSIGHSYDNLSANHGVNVVHDWAISVDSSARKVRLGSGATVSYDRLVLSPGIDIKYDSIDGYSVEAQTKMPHAWKSGTQVKVLRDQVLNMPKGGTLYGSSTKPIQMSSGTLRAHFYGCSYT